MTALYPNAQQSRAATGRGRRAESARPGGRSGAARRCRRTGSPPATILTNYPNNKNGIPNGLKPESDTRHFYPYSVANDACV